MVPGNDIAKTIALAGNPNVGKSTLFNALTGLNQHTGNWPGKTVANARGSFRHKGREYALVDLPGCYSLQAHSPEEEISRDFICFGQPDLVIVVCDAVCLERNLNLTLQILESTPHVVVCVNLMDEAEKKGIRVDMAALSALLGVPVVGISARSRRGIDALLDAISAPAAQSPAAYRVPYPAYIEEAVQALGGDSPHARWQALRTLEQDASGSALRARDDIAHALIREAERIGRAVVRYDIPNYDKTDRALDALLTSARTGFPMMLLVLMAIFWITIAGANYPSQWLSDGLSWLELRLLSAFTWAGAPAFLTDMLVLGVYRVLAWVVAVMLPPMAIFFPLFTLLEDAGYLPRVAFNLDRAFQKCHACGKQALTMCMGFGCNAVGVTGCRIIDSPREKLIAIITNSLVPCNGRFPTIIAILSMFFAGAAAGPWQPLLSALLLTGVICLGIVMTFIVSRLLSATILKGMPSSFTLELPPYRRPQFGQVIVRSMLDRTLFVLGRAVAVAAPAGLLIWLLANVSVAGVTVLSHLAAFLDPFARVFGMDGVIWIGFILGFPANEIVMPVILMAYTAQGSLLSIDNLAALRQLLAAHGWTWITAVNVILFSLMHWPCSTTCLTIKKETGSLKWTAISFLTPTAVGLFVCFAFTSIARLFS